MIPSFAEMLPASTAVPVVNADFVQMLGFQDTGSAVTLTTSQAAGAFPWLAARWVGVLGGTAGLPVPSPAAFADTTEITGAFLNSNLRDTVNFLAFPPMARLSNAGTTQTIPSGGADTAITMTTATVNGTNSDNYSGWSSGSNPSRYTFPRAGRYYVYGQVSFLAGSTGTYQASLRVSGSTTWVGSRAAAASTSTAGLSLTCERYLRVTAGQYVEVTCNQNSGSTVSLTNSSSTHSKLIVVWRGA